SRSRRSTTSDRGLRWPPAFAAGAVRRKSFRRAGSFQTGRNYPAGRSTANAVGRKGTRAYGLKILQGAELADHRLQQPTKLQLVANLKSAKALGLTTPPAVLARADEVLQRGGCCFQRSPVSQPSSSDSPMLFFHLLRVHAPGVKSARSLIPFPSAE